MNLNLSELSHDGRPLPDLPGLFTEKSNVQNTLHGSKNVLVTSINSMNNRSKKGFSSQNINYDPFVESIDSMKGNEKRSLLGYTEENKENLINQSLATIFDKFVTSPIKSKNSNINNSKITDSPRVQDQSNKERMFLKDSINSVQLSQNLKSNEGISECISYLMKKIKGYEVKESKYKEMIKDKDGRINQLELKLNDTLDIMDGMKNSIKESSKVIEKLKQSSYQQQSAITLNMNDVSKGSVNRGQLSSLNNSMSESMQDLYRKELSDLKNKVVSLDVDKKVLKEIIREMIMEGKKEKKALNEKSLDKSRKIAEGKEKDINHNCNYKNEDDQDSRRRTGRSRRDRNRSKSRASANSYISRDNSRSYSKKGDSDNLRIIKNPNFAKVIDFDE